jgi:site-specific DNA recombinase
MQIPLTKKPAAYINEKGGVFLENAAIYIRVSTEEQTEYSPQAQYDELLAYAKEHQLMVQENHVFIDNGISGKSALKRPAFLSMMKLSKAKPRPFDVVLVHKYDRFARNKEDSVLYKAMLKKSGIRVISIKEPIPTDDKFAVIYESMLEAMAEYYSLNLAEEVKKTMIKKAHQGEHQSIAPFGYRNKDKTFELVPEEAVIVKHIFHQFLQQDKSCWQIAKEINQMGIKTHRGNAFESRAITYILTNPVYAGFSRWTPTEKRPRNENHPDTVIVPANHTPIITKELFKAVQNKINANKKRPHKRPTTLQNQYTWLQGILLCGNCNHPLLVSNHYKNGNVQLQCGSYNHGLCAVSHSISTARLIPVILNTLQALVDFSHITAYSVSFQKDNDCLKTLEQYKMQRNQLLRKLERVKEAYLNSIDSLEEYTKNKTELQNQLQEIDYKIDTENKQSSLFEKNATKFPNVCSLISSPQFTLSQKKVIAKNIFDKIIYKKSTQTIEIHLNIIIS